MTKHRTRLTASIGDLRLTLVTDEPDLCLRVQPVMKRFLVDSSDADVVVRAQWGELHEVPTASMAFDSGSVWRLYRDNSHHLFRFTSPAFGTVPYKQACVSSDFTSADIVLHRNYFDRRQPVDALEYPLDELLIVNLLGLGRGVEVHACGIADSDGRGYLFVGQSGAGKTTTARLWRKAPGIDVLSDDRIILRCFDGKIWMYGTPWHGEADCASSHRALLTHVLFLGRGRNNEIVPLRSLEAIARLIACSFLPFYNADALDRALAFFERVTAAIPCGDLRFVVDDRVLEFVREYANEDRASFRAVS